MDQESTLLKGGLAGARPRVLVCDEMHEDGLEILGQNGIDVDYRPTISHERLIEVIGDYDCIIVRSKTKITADILRRAKNLRLIARAGSGLENIDLEEARSRGIKVIRCPGAIASSVAELTIAFMITLARRFDKAIYYTKSGLWQRCRFTGFELFGKTLGIIGVGNVGARVAKIASGLGMKLLLNDVKKISLRGIERAEQTDLETLLRNSDFVTIHVPLNSWTKGMINEERLRLMKRSAFLINTSRPEIIDSKALYKALENGWIAGVAVDATTEWLKKNAKLLKFENFLCTPHIGAQTHEARRRASIRIAEKVVEELKRGGMPAGVPRTRIRGSFSEV